MNGDKEFKFDRLINHSKYSPTDDKSSQKGAWSGHVNHLNLVGTNHISKMAENTVVKFCTHVGYVKSQHADYK